MTCREWLNASKHCCPPQSLDGICLKFAKKQRFYGETCYSQYRPDTALKIPIFIQRGCASAHERCWRIRIRAIFTLPVKVFRRPNGILLPHWSMVTSVSGKP